MDTAESTTALSLQDLLDVRPVGADVFLGARTANPRPGIFGGQLAAQALAAAHRTVEMPAHSLHGYFLRSGDAAAPVTYRVERVRDGRSSAIRRVIGYQGERTLFELSASFSRPGEGLEHADRPPPDVPAPETVPDMSSHLAGWGLGGPPPPQLAMIDFRPVSVVSPLAPRAHPPTQCVWFRAASALPDDDPAAHRQALTYGSDMYLLATALRPHGIASASRDVTFMSLDHAVWFHRPFRADEWLLHVQHSPTASAGRAYSTGTIFRRDGTLVASTAQEGFIRPPTPRSPQ